MRTSLSPTQQLEELVALLVNNWKRRQDHENKTVDLPDVIRKFGNLSLQSVYEMVTSDLFTLHPGGPVTAGMVHESLQPMSHEQLQKNMLPHDFMETTPVKKWLIQKEREGVTMSFRLQKMLHQNADDLDYVEYITKFAFTRCGGGNETSWQEFVKVRGY